METFNIKLLIPSLMCPKVYLYVFYFNILRSVLPPFQRQRKLFWACLTEVWTESSVRSDWRWSWRGGRCQEGKTQSVFYDWEKCASTNQLTLWCVLLLLFAALSPFVGVRWGICAVKCLDSFAVYTFQLKFLFAQINKLLHTVPRQNTLYILYQHCFAVFKSALFKFLSYLSFSQKNMPFWRVSCRADLEALSHALELDYL